MWGIDSRSSRESDKDKLWIVYLGHARDGTATVTLRSNTCFPKSLVFCEALLVLSCHKFCMTAMVEVECVKQFGIEEGAGEDSPVMGSC